MSAEIIPQIRNFLQNRMHSAGAKSLSILLFGGEPLLHPEAVVQLLTQLEGLGLADVSVTTNGTTLGPPLLTTLRNFGLSNLQLSLDGHDAAHDLTRHNLSGVGSYARIMTNLRDCAAQDLDWDVRVNLTPQNLGGLSSLLEELSETLPRERTTVYFARVMDAGIFDDVLTEDENLAETVLALYEETIELGLGPHRPQDDQTCVDCGAMGGQSGCVINADGTLYSCWESVGRPAMAVGHVERGYMDEATMRSRWVSCGYLSDPGKRSSEFRDRVDAGILSMLRRRGMLGSAKASPTGAVGQVSPS